MDTRHPGSGFFWREMGPSGHACQVYANDEELLESLTAYAGGALWAGESAVVIATRRNLERLDERLRGSGLDLAHFRGNDRYLTFSAEATLARFMVEGWPDEERFRQVIGGVLERARGGGRAVRAYGEMVAVLWARGEYQAAIRLEHLWNRLLGASAFRLLCGYPRADYARAGAPHVEAVRAAHTHFAGA